MLIDLVQVPVGINIVREYQELALGREPEVGGSGGGDAASVLEVAGESEDIVVGLERDVLSIDIKLLLLFGWYDARERASAQPECLTTLIKLYTRLSRFATLDKTVMVRTEIWIGSTVDSTGATYRDLRLLIHTGMRFSGAASGSVSLNTHTLSLKENWL
jgi:hypothetical protein